MFLRFNVVANGGTCWVNAWDDKSNERLTYKFHHTPHYMSLRTSLSPFCDNDKYIIFKSSVKIEDWIERMRSSEFNSPRYYHMLKHNCAKSAVFALQAAEIKLFPEEPVIQFNRIYFNFFTIRLPLNSLTPLDLYSRAKIYKLKQLEASNYDMQYQFTELRVKLCSSIIASEIENKLANKIIEEVAKRHHKQPEHTENQLEVLMQTYNLLTHLPTDEEYTNYLKSADKFKVRVLSKEAKVYLCYMTVCYLMGAVIGFYLNNPFTPKNSTLKKAAQLGNLAFTYASLINIFSFRKIIVDSDLTKTMKELGSIRLSERERKFKM